MLTIPNVISDSRVIKRLKKQPFIFNRFSICISIPELNFFQFHSFPSFYIERNDS